MGIFDTALGIGGSLLSGMLNNSAAQDRQDAAQTFSAQQYATRYQTTVADMQAAGLNPGLAYGGISGSSPTSSAASSAGTPDIGASYNQSRLASAQVGQVLAQEGLAKSQSANLDADTANKEAAKDLMEAQAAAARGSAWQSHATIEKINTEVKEITNKLENEYYANDVLRMKALATELLSQVTLNGQKSITEGAVRSHLYSLVQKIGIETNLLKLDEKAANELGNVGREAGQLKPIFDILRQFLRK